MARREVFRITDFSGGWNPDQSPSLIADNEAADIQNFRIDKIGSLVSRRGTERFLDVANSSNILALGRWLDPINPHSGQIILANSGGQLQRVNLGTDTYDTLYSGLDGAAETHQFLPLRQSLIYANGSDVPIRYNGVAARPLGLDVPPTAPGLAEGSSPGLTGVYGYTYTYVKDDTGLETNASPITYITATDDRVIITVPAPVSPNVDRVRIYRTLVGGAVPLFLVELTLPTLTYDDGAADSTLTGNIAAPFDHLPPPVAFDHIAYHQGYMFGAKGDTIYWSRPLEEDYWPFENSTQVPFDGNDVIKAIKSHQDTLLIFGHHNIVLLAGSGGQWQLARQDVALGTASYHAFADVDGTLVFLSHEALHTFPGVQQFAPKLSRIIGGLDSQELHHASLCYVPEERSVILSLPNMTYSVHLVNQGITKYTIRTPQWLQGGVNGDGRPLFIDKDLRYVNLYDGETDLGQPISVAWQSKQFQLTNPEFVKFFRRIGAYATTGSETVVSVVISDQSNSYPVTLVSQQGQDPSLWDVMGWDNLWSPEGVSYFIASLPAQTLIGRLFQVRVSSEVTRQTEITPPFSFQYREADRFLGN